MTQIIHNAPIVYLSLSLFLLFIRIKKMDRNETMGEIIYILAVTFLLNTLCINGLNKISWYLVLFFTIIPVGLAMLIFFAIKIGKGKWRH
jgi:hypothetical protein